MSIEDRKYKYNFDTPHNRRGTNSMKWEVEPDELPMWVADMDFQTAPSVTAAIHTKAAAGIFGYTIVPECWNQSIVEWWKHRHQFIMEPEWLIFSTGVVPAISSVVRKLMTVGEKVLIQSPVYNIFYNSIINNGRHILSSDLALCDGRYEIDFEDLEKKLADPQVSMMILCNPHNPVGRVWRSEELERIAELCWENHVIVVSDEIHCDLTLPGNTYIPFAAVSEKALKNSVTCIAPTKAFNLAGLQTAAVCVPDECLRNKVCRGLNTDEVAEPNAFAVESTLAAFAEGEQWLEELRIYLAESRTIAEDYIRARIPDLHPIAAEATYLMWIDCREITDDGEKLCDFIRRETGLYLAAGSEYGENGAGFMRLNLACPHERLRDGLERLKRGVNMYQKIIGGKEDDL